MPTMKKPATVKKVEEEKKITAEERKKQEQEFLDAMLIESQTASLIMYRSFVNMSKSGRRMSVALIAMSLVVLGLTLFVGVIDIVKFNRVPEGLIQLALAAFWMLLIWQQVKTFKRETHDISRYGEQVEKLEKALADAEK